jgi:hypothetical protein
MDEMMGAAGSGLKDAGMQLLIDAGVVTGGAAGRGVAGSVAATKDASTGMGSDAKAQEPTGDGLPRPHWVLRDKNGDAVQAEVYPGYAYDTYVQHFTTVNPLCVSISFMGARSIGLPYKLSTGKLDGCEGSPPVASWRDWPSAYFVTATCNGAGYYIGPYFSGIKVGSTYYHADGPATMHVATVYSWNAQTSMCTAYTPANGQDVWAYKPVPSDVVNLLPNPPYTMELVY